jgi:hypothetical protein
MVRSFLPRLRVSYQSVVASRDPPDRARSRSRKVHRSATTTEKSDRGAEQLRHSA